MVLASQRSGKWKARRQHSVRRFADRKKLLETSGRIYSVVTYGTVDGPGIRYVLFLQGCPLRCLYCHNPDSVTGDGMATWTAEHALANILRYRTFIQSGGVTLSGGEPLAQPRFVLALTKLLHENGIHTAIDTSGCIPPDSVSEVIDAADMLLLDIKAYDPEISRNLTGQDNKNAFATLDYCERTGKPVWIRHVLLRGYTLDDAQLDSLARFLKPYSCVKQVELLPFHQLGAGKWKRMGRAYALTGVQPTTDEEIQHAREIFHRHGIEAH